MPVEHLEDFSAPWAQAIINDPTWEPVYLFGREVFPPPSTENALMAVTLDRPDGVRAIAAFNRFPPPGPSSSPAQHVGLETRMLVSLGTAVNGHSGICHGGFIGTLLDEVSGQIVWQVFGSNIVTADMSVQYKKMLPTPNVVLCRAWLEKEPERRKVWVRASVEDGLGGVYATGTTLFIQTKSKI